MKKLSEHPVIGHVYTRPMDLVDAETGRISMTLPGNTYDVIGIGKVKDHLAYYTNKVYKIHVDGSEEPLIILNGLVDHYDPIPGGTK